MEYFFCQRYDFDESKVVSTEDEEVPRDEDGVTRGVSTEVVEEEELNNFLETKHLLLYSVNK